MALKARLGPVPKASAGHPVRAALTKPSKAGPKVRGAKVPKPKAPPVVRPAKVVVPRQVASGAGSHVAPQRAAKATTAVKAAKPAAAALSATPAVRAAKPVTRAGTRQGSVAAQVVATLPSVRPPRQNRLWLKPAFATPSKPTAKQKRKMLGI